MAQPVIGFIGLGRMGNPMAARLLAAGCDVVIADTSASAVDALAKNGARPAKGPREVADAADVVFASLPTPEVVRAVALGPEGVVHGHRMKVFVDLSTTGPQVSRLVAAGLAEVGRAELLDCPVSGGVAGAGKGTLTLMVAGSTQAIDMTRELLLHLGKPYICGSRPGNGQMAKLINNLLSVISMAACSEALVLAERAGVDPRALFDVVNVSSGSSNASQTKVPRHILPRTYDFGFATALSQKDARLCLEQAEALGVPMLVGSVARQVLTLTSAAFGADADFTMMHKMYEQLAGAEINKE